MLKLTIKLQIYILIKANRDKLLKTIIFNKIKILVITQEENLTQFSSKLRDFEIDQKITNFILSVKANKKRFVETNQQK